MRTITAKVYEVSELPDTVKASVLDRFRYFEVDDNNFIDPIFEEFKATSKFVVDEVFYNRNSIYGVAFTATGLKEILKSELIATLSEYKRGFVRNIDPHIILDAGSIGWKNKTISLYISFDGEPSFYDMSDIHCRLYDLIDEAYVAECKQLLKTIEDTYTKLTSDDYITDYLEANHYEFFINGELCDETIDKFKE